MTQRQRVETSCISHLPVRPGPGARVFPRRPHAATAAWQRPPKGTPTLAVAANPAVWIVIATERTSSRFAGSRRLEPVTNFAGRRLEPPLSVRWPPKDGQPTPTLKLPRLPMDADRAPLASGRAAHADDGVRDKLSMNSGALMEGLSAAVCLTFDVRGGPLAGRPLDGGVRRLCGATHCLPDSWRKRLIAALSSCGKPSCMANHPDFAST